jgi:hypothetical protein
LAHYIYEIEGFPYNSYPKQDWERREKLNPIPKTLTRGINPSQ